MSKSSHSRRDASLAKDLPCFTGETPDLFQQLENEPRPAADLDIQFELLAAFTTAIKLARSRGMSRERIVDEMNRLMPELRGGVTLRQLNSWTAPSQDYKEFPARFVPAFCAATECDLPLRVMAQLLNRELVDAREAKAKRLGELRIAGAALKRQERQLTRELT